jgi:hypothetical protein
VAAARYRVLATSRVRAVVLTHVHVVRAAPVSNGAAAHRAVQLATAADEGLLRGPAAEPPRPARRSASRLCRVYAPRS